MLSAYMRFKYPNIIAGSIAASAPIYLIGGAVPRTFFFQDVTQVGILCKLLLLFDIFCIFVL